MKPHSIEQTEQQIRSEENVDTVGLNEEEKIRRLVDRLQAATSRKDVAGILDCFDETSVMYVLNPPLKSPAENKQKAKENLRSWFASWTGDLKYYSREVEIHASDEVAFVSGLTYMGGARADGSKTDLWFRETLGLRKRGHEWKIVHQHQSVPMLMDGSLKAAVDLKPEGH